MGQKSVLYLSLHQSPLYPGTGHKSQDNCLNFPMPPGSDDTVFLSNLKNACSAIQDFKPHLLGISAGFDTFEEDPLTQLFISLSAYQSAGKTIADLNISTFIVMEGGYSAMLPECVFQFLRGFEV